jgi:hypothetical protein
MKEWHTKAKDMQIAQLIIEEHAKDQETDTLGLFELVVNQSKKRMNFKLAHWVILIAKRFNSIYGANQGDYVTRQVISQCITQGQTLH